MRRLSIQVGTYVVNALSKMREALMFSDDRILATNIVRRVSLGDRSFVNPIKYLLDPDIGLVQRSRSRMVRNNADFYLLDNDDPPDRGYEIVYGKNMTGISWSKSTDGVVTRIVPIGEDADGRRMLLPEQWIDSPHIGEYPVIHTGTLTVSDAKEVVVEENDGEEEPASDIEPFTKEQCYELMRQAAADEFAKGCDMPDLTLDIDFIHIGDTKEYKQYRNLERVFLYDLVRIRHASTGFVAKAQVSGYEWDTLTKRYKSITVGNVFAVESSAVAGYQLSEGAVTATKIAPGSVSGSSLRELSVTNGKIAHAAIGTANIQDAAITRAQIADAAVGTAQIGQAAITQALIGAEAVGTTQIADGSITDAKIVELTANKINAGTLSVERLELVGSYNSVVYALNNSGGLVSQNVDSLDGDVLTERSITGDKIVANAITANEIASRTITSNEILAGTITGGEIAADTIEGSNIKAGAITTNHVASNFGKTLDLSSNTGINQRVEQVYSDTRRKRIGKSYSGTIFGTKIICGDCGGYYGQKVWHSNDAYRRVVWRCNRKYGNGKKCATPTITEDEIKDLFVQAFNKMMSERTSACRDCEELAATLEDTTELDRAIADTQEEIDTIVERNRRLIREHAATGMAAEEFDEKAAMLNEHHTAADGTLARLKAAREDHLTRSKAIRRFLALLAEQPVSLDDWDEQAWNLLVSQVTIREDGSAEFVFRGEITITVKAK